MITKIEYETLKLEHEEACKISDYSKMIMMGDEKDIKMKEYLRESGECSHSSIEELQGGQVEVCRRCGKTWGN